MEHRERTPFSEDSVARENTGKEERRESFFDFAVDQLNADTVDAQPRFVDFWKGSGEEWEIAVDRTDEEIENDEWEPLMDDIYPLPKDFEPSADIKARLDEAGDVTLVRLEDPDGPRYALALTGGGMDLSWDIARAYALLGYLPPMNVSDLPRFGSTDFALPRNRKIIEACERSADVVIARARLLKESLERMRVENGSEPRL